MFFVATTTGYDRALDERPVRPVDEVIYTRSLTSV
jgi:hypothetical protein